MFYLLECRHFSISDGKLGEEIGPQWDKFCPVVLKFKIYKSELHVYIK